MKRIAIIAHGLSDGGAERVAALLSNKLHQQGYEILLIAAYSMERVYNLSEGIEYKYIRKGRNKLLRFLKRTIEIDKLVSQYHSDIIISFIINETILTIIKNRIPVVFSLRIDPAKATEKWRNRLFCSFVYSKAKAIVFQTPNARDFFTEKIKNKGFVIGNPLSPNLPYWNANNHEKRIITACRLTEQKNLPMLISGFSIFEKKHSDYSLWIYGEGPLKNELAVLSNRLNIRNKVYFPGFVDNIHDIMAHSAVFALTSNYEGLSNSMLEALAIGIPTVCTDCPPGGAKIYIKNHENGILIPMNDAEALANSFCELIENKQFSLDTKKKANTIRELLSEDRVFNAWKYVLECN